MHATHTTGRVRTRTTKALGAAVCAVLLATAVTGCQSGSKGDDAKGPRSSAGASSAGSGTGTGSPGDPTPEPTGGASEPPAPDPVPSAPGTGPAPTKKPGGTGTPLACNDNDLSIDTSVWRQDSGRHLLVTATNFTDKPCTLYHHPYVGFGAVIEGPLPVAGPRPRAIATIGPRQKAYAGVFLFEGGEKTVAVEAISLGYQDHAFGSNKDVGWLDSAFPKEIGSLNVGRDARVTYWHLDRGTIEDILFRSGLG
ncbi:DUF4232 domain-containing protein [Streptomyces sp. NPDC097619]|uniref:DUF4232 domain-containing protein n=1 Tax=Streptomyces sp. NPDC097619 TaxID=3157228 RepID=UPI00333261AA